jgi:hypothetical protein
MNADTDGAAPAGEPPDDLWAALADAGDPFAGAIEDAVGRARDGRPVAVVGEPFSGRESVLRRVADRLDAAVVELEPGTEPPALDGPAVLVGTGRLFTREVGGFEPLDALLRAVATTDAPVVAGWNTYAWSYCRQARAVDRRFDAVTVPDVERETLGTLVERWAGTDVTFRAAPREATAFVETEREPLDLPFLGEVTVPVPRLNRGALAARPTDEDPETAVVRRLHDLADGNPGVAWALWQDAVADAGEVAPTDVETPVAVVRDRERRRTDNAGPGTPSGNDPGETALDRYDAVCLRVALSAERLPRETVAAALGPVGTDAGTVLARLSRRGYLRLTDETVALRAAAVPDAVALTERRRIP